jgi:hypothetical protein
MITEEGRGLLVDWDFSKSLGMSGAPSPPERTVRVVETYGLPSSSVEIHPLYDRALGNSWLLGSR